MQAHDIKCMFCYVPPDEFTAVKHAAINEAVDAMEEALKPAEVAYGAQPEDFAPQYEALNCAAENLVTVIVAQCPPSADRSAAIRCVRLSRNAFNKVLSHYQGGGSATDMLASVAEDVMYQELLKAQFQANAAIALKGEF